jgi:hypothetical protein
MGPSRPLRNGELARFTLGVLPCSTLGATSLLDWPRGMQSRRSTKGPKYAAAGGLASYGTRLEDAYHQIGFYAGSILKGAKPADLPVVQ